MKCVKCNYAKRLKTTYASYDYSTKSGIDGVWLHDVKKFTCPGCKEVFFELGDMEDINRQIAVFLCATDELTRSHFKWIRTHLLDLTYFQMAKIVRVNPDYLIDMEQHLRPITTEIQSMTKNYVAKKILTKKIKMLIAD